MGTVGTSVRPTTSSPRTSFKVATAFLPPVLFVFLRALLAMCSFVFLRPRSSSSCARDLRLRPRVRVHVIERPCGRDLHGEDLGRRPALVCLSVARCFAVARD